MTQQTALETTESWPSQAAFTINRLNYELNEARKQLAAMREAIREVEQALQKIIREVPACLEGYWFWPHVSPDGDYLGEIPADPASAMQAMQVIADEALAKLQLLIKQ